MTRWWLAIAGVGGFASVMAGAVAAHLSAEPDSAALLHTGALYGMVHAVALVAVIPLAQGREPRRGPAAVAGWSFASGIVLFSFSLFALALYPVAWLQWVTPVGGLAFMVGWASLAILACRRR
jgi:uncharacterized membrane protein YgdD (TMEM256/DUF423 family)